VFSAGKTFLALGAQDDVAPAQPDEGVYSVTLAAPDPAMTAAWLADHGASVAHEDDSPAPRYSLDLDGVRFVLASPQAA